MAGEAAHAWTDDALSGRGGWLAGIRFTCGRCGVERRAVFETGFHVLKDHATAKHSWIYFVNRQRTDKVPECNLI